MILEIWSGSENPPGNHDEPPILKPSFRIMMSKTRLPTGTIEALARALKRIRTQKQKAVVESKIETKQWPKDLGPLLSSAEANALNCFMIGLEVEPVFRDAQNGEIYPLLLRKLHQGVARAIKQGVFKFSHQQTTLRPANYQALGRRALVKAVWEIDRSLAGISNAIIDALERKVDYMNFYRRNFDNEEMAAL